MVFRAIINTKTFLEKCRRDNISAFAAQTALFIIVSLIPFLMVFSSLLKYTVVSEADLLEIVNQIMPEYIAPFITSIIDEVYHKSMGIVSATAFIALWSAAKGVQYLADGLNIINGIRETRNWIVLRFYAAVYTIIFLVVIVAALVLLVFGNSIQDLILGYVPVLSHAVTLFFKMRGLIAIAVLSCMFAVMFQTLPNKKELKNRRLTFLNQLPGAVLCAVMWYLFSFAISVYVDYFNGFSMYGSLTTIVLVMLWLYFCMYIMMMSAEINVLFGEAIQRKLAKKRADK